MQLLGLLDEPARKTKKTSAAVLDLGGASTQIVFEPEFEDKSTLQPGDHVYDLKFAEQPHVLYQHSYLGFGLMQARRAANNLVGFNWLWSQASTASEWDQISSKDEVRRGANCGG